MVCDLSVSQQLISNQLGSAAPINDVSKCSPTHFAAVLRLGPSTIAWPLAPPLCFYRWNNGAPVGALKVPLGLCTSSASCPSQRPTC
jgi:hypothetical protein